jgi:hypothetical protein
MNSKDKRLFVLPTFVFQIVFFLVTYEYKKHFSHTRLAY